MLALFNYSPGSQDPQKFVVFYNVRMPRNYTFFATRHTIIKVYTMGPSYHSQESLRRQG